jgi:hypothetical protein
MPDEQVPTDSFALLSYQVAEVKTAVVALDIKVDTITATVERAQGVLAVVRWLGVGGVAIAVVALLKSFGVHLV